ncbi:gp16 family protein [Pararhodospirillum photometricum]|uniref:Mu-like prophage protein gp16 n=1 Tax=Pararhodospirillum photometricum DSM 122 TaxID=1150469 RepID=H6SQM4_PARPM|nr:regulatory protein GemA [Pararhodospirillum photometricum]CCG07339.1 Putative uncharacterized protein [Pararhodospirillum photometricum DSM 122]
MTCPADDLPALRRALHAGARTLGLDEEARRGLMRRVTGLDSSKDMSAGQLRAVLAEYDRLRGPEVRKAWRRPTSARADVRLLFGLWRGLHEAGLIRDASPRACRAWVERQTGVSDPDWLTVAQARACAEALKAWRARGCPSQPEDA